MDALSMFCMLFDYFTTTFLISHVEDSVWHTYFHAMRQFAFKFAAGMATSPEEIYAQQSVP